MPVTAGAWWWQGAGALSGTELADCCKVFKLRGFPAANVSSSKFFQF
jgi:hypothetical protein